MNRIQIINALIEQHHYATYLEIGVNTPAQPGYSHTSIHIETKHGVDPNVDTTYRMPSDEFFAKNKNTYDIVFVDGLHTFAQAHRDIENALLALNPGGTIVVHDCNPTKEVTQRPTQPTSRLQRLWHGIRYGSWHGVWHGDVWKAILKLRMERSDIEIYTIDADEGCTIIRRGSQELYTPTVTDPYTFAYFKKHRKEILHLISVQEFKKKFD